MAETIEHAIADQIAAVAEQIGKVNAALKAIGEAPYDEDNPSKESREAAGAFMLEKLNEGMVPVVVGHMPDCGLSVEYQVGDESHEWEFDAAGKMEFFRWVDGRATEIT